MCRCFDVEFGEQWEEVRTRQGENTVEKLYKKVCVIILSFKYDKLMQTKYLFSNTGPYSVPSPFGRKEASNKNNDSLTGQCRWIHRNSPGEKG